MAIWLAKAVVQKTISLLPFKHQLNFLFQKYVTKGVNLTDALFADKLFHALKHIHYFRKYSQQQNFTALEIGTGWYPIVPVSLFLAGAAKVYTLDIAPLMNHERIVQTLQKFAAQESRPEFLPERIQQLKAVLAKAASLNQTELLRELNIESMIGDARQLPLPDHSIDLVNSNNTYEHIPPFILLDILREFKRVAKSGGIMSHAIDMSDHFAHLDKSITPYNFLQYSEVQWNLIDNSIQPQNRLRIYECKQLYADAGVPLTETEITTAGNVEEVRALKLSERFASASAEENAVLHASFISIM